MDFFNKAMEKLTKTSTDVAKKAKDLTGIAKLNSQIANYESTVKATYAEIGIYVYENLREDAPEEIAAKMTAMAEIDRIKAEILKLKGCQKCQQCEKEVSADVAFCPYCGNKMPEPVVDVVDEGEVKEVVEEAVDNAAETVEEAVETVAEKVEEAAETIAEKVEEVIK